MNGAPEVTVLPSALLDLMAKWGPGPWPAKVEREAARLRAEYLATSERAS